MSSRPAIVCESLGKRYQVKTGPRSREDFWAVRDVSFSLPTGETLGLVGRNGAGKSTLLKLLSRITTPTEGRAAVTGSVGSLLEVGTGFHPELSGRENVFLNGTLLGMTRREVAARFDEIVAFAQVDRFVDEPVKHYSSGMYVRLAFAVAAHLRADVLFVDEVLAVGDRSFQQRSLGKMDELADEGRTLIFVSHNLESVRRLCHSSALIEDGRLLDFGATASVLDKYVGRRRAEPVVMWATAEQPGDAEVRVRGLAALRQDGCPSSDFQASEGFSIVVEYELLRPGPRPQVSLVFRNPEGVVLFGVNDRQAPGVQALETGVHSSRCLIPPNLLAEGGHLVTVTVQTSTGVHARLEDALVFDISDRGGPGTVRGDYSGDWVGVMRPWLDFAIDDAPALGAAS